MENLPRSTIQDPNATESSIKHMDFVYSEEEKRSPKYRAVNKFGQSTIYVRCLFTLYISLKWSLYAVSVGILLWSKTCVINYVVLFSLFVLRIHDEISSIAFFLYSRFSSMLYWPNFTFMFLNKLSPDAMPCHALVNCVSFDWWWLRERFSYCFTICHTCTYMYNV